MSPLRKILFGSALAASTLTGGALGASLLGTAHAAETTTTTAVADSTDSTATATAPSTDSTATATDPGCAHDGDTGSSSTTAPSTAETPQT